MKSRRRTLMLLWIVSIASIALGGLACQPASGPAQGGSVNALETGFSDETPLADNDESSSAGSFTASGDSDFGSAGGIEDPFEVIGPAFQGIGFQSHSSTCDPFDEAYGTCL